MSQLMAVLYRSFNGMNQAMTMAEFFYNSIRRPLSADGMFPIEFERRNSVRLESI